MEKSFFDRIYFDNSLRSYLIVLSIILLALLIKKLISRFCAGLLYRVVGKAGKKIDKQSFIDLVLQPLELFVLLFIAFVCIDKLNFPTALDFNVFKYSSRQIIDSISNGLLVIIFIWLCVRLIDFTALVLEDRANITHDVSDNQLIVFFKDFFKVILVMIGVLLVLHFSFHRNIANLFTGLSIVGAAIALATRESLENLIASFIIFFDKPFTTGDTVKVQQFTGTVEKIGLRSTRIRTENKTYITVPNKQMVDSIIDNISLRTVRRAEIKLEMDVNTSSQELSSLVAAAKAILSNKSIIENYHVHLTDPGKGVHIITIDFYAPLSQTVEEFNDLKETININLIQATEQLKLRFARNVITTAV